MIKFMKQDDKNKEKEKRKTLKAFSMVTQIGLNMAACVFVGVIAGKFLDEWLGTSPWLLIIFVLLGSGAAFKVIYDIGKDWE